MNPYFSGKRIIVTGAGRGIGKELCKTLAKLGANVIGISKTAKNLESLKTEVPTIETHTQDIAEWNDTRKLVEHIGLVDMLVNNAGMNITKQIIDIKQEEYDSIFNVNVKAAFNISQAVAKTMIEKQSGGAIVNVSSIVAMGAFRSASPYCCSKAALDMMTKTMALEFGPHQIRVNSVNPTGVLTDLAKAWAALPGNDVNDVVKKIPMGRLAEEADVVNAIVFLLSDKASMINGILMPVDGGQVAQV